MGLTINRRSIIATLEMTASEWELYDGLPYVESVAYDLNRKFEECLARGMSGNEVHGIMYTLMQGHREFGALDSKPQYQLRNLIKQVYQDFD